MAATLAQLEKKRASFQKRIVTLQAQIVGFAPDVVTASHLELALIGVKELRTHLETLFENTHFLCATDNDFTPHEDEFTTLFGCLDTLQIKVMDLQKSTSVRTRSHVSPSFKLERIKLPQFSGAFHEWPSFRDLFSASVDKNSSLSGAEKMIHLKSCLKGEAAAIVASLTATHISYDEAWKSVLKRFAVKREIVFATIQRFDDHKPLLTESSTGLRSLADVLNETIRSLKVLGVPVEHWDLILIYFALRKMDPESRKQWSLEQDTDPPTMKELGEFLEDRARALNAAAAPSSKPQSQTRGSGSFEKKTSSSHHAVKAAQPAVCLKCGDVHRLFHYPVLLNQTLNERKKFVRDNLLCFNCLAREHTHSQCTSKYTCKTCRGRHYSLLHPESVSVPSSTEETVPVTSSLAVYEASSNYVVLMGTLLATADDVFGQKRNVRIFVDNGWDNHFISEACVSMLGLPRRNGCYAVQGIGECDEGSTRGAVTVRLYSKVRDFSLEIHPLIIPRLTGLLPRIPCRDFWPHLRGLELADPTFNCSNPVDILLEAKHAARILIPGLIQGPVNSLTAQNTRFGWMLSGEVRAFPTSSRRSTSNFVACKHVETDLDSAMEKFWLLEEPESKSAPMTNLEEACEDHFATTHSRDAERRYVVKLPFNEAPALLGESRSIAVTRFAAVKKETIPILELCGAVLFTKLMTTVRILPHQMLDGFYHSD